MLSTREDVVPQSIDGSDPPLVILPIAAYRKLIIWTDRDESEIRMAPQMIYDAAAIASHVVLLEDDFLTLKNSWQVSDEQKFFLVAGREKKGAAARALYFPDTGKMLVLKDATMAASEAKVDMSIYSAIRKELTAEGGPVKRIDGELVFTRNYLFPDPSTAASVLAGCRVGAFEGWENVRTT